MISEAKKVYNLLNDDISRDIFIKKMMFLFSSDYRYIFDIVNCYVDCVDPYFSWEKYIERMKFLSHNKSIMIYGAGGEGHALQSILRANDISVDTFVDRNYSVYSDSNVISPSELLQRYHKNKNIVISIGTEMYYWDIKEFLVKNGVCEADICGGAAKVDKQYFEDEIVKYVEDEIFVDCGSLNLSTCKYFIDSCSTNIKKIFAFEPDQVNYSNCISSKLKKEYENILVFPFGVYSSNSKIGFINSCGGTSRINPNSEEYIEVRKLDTVLENEKVTFIKMDIEGAELEALKGAKTIIQKNKPKLAISVYHKSEDLIEIPLLIHDMVPDYRFYLRHYSIYPVETILYAIAE